MSKNIKILLVIVLIIFILIFFIQITYKTIKNGNNINKSTNDLIEDILNISSYEAKLEVTINSNKTTNKYELEQYYMSPNFFKQIVKSPDSIENLEIIYNGNNLEVRNTNLGLSKIYKNYMYLNENMLWFNCFIDICKKHGYIIEEVDTQIILITKIKGKGKLYISKKTSEPTKIEILDNSNQTKIYIEYKEIKINNIQKDNIL